MTEKMPSVLGVQVKPGATSEFINESHNWNLTNFLAFSCDRAVMEEMEQLRQVGLQIAQLPY